MIVAMIAMRMVQVAFDKVIDVVAVGDCLMTAAGPVLVPLGVLAAVMRGRAGSGIGAADRQSVFFNLAAGRMMEMAVVDIIHVAVMLDCFVTAARSVLMRVVGVNVSHGRDPFVG
jgi:hypothetical protein